MILKYVPWNVNFSTHSLLFYWKWNFLDYDWNAPKDWFLILAHNLIKMKKNDLRYKYNFIIGGVAFILNNNIINWSWSWFTTKNYFRYRFWVCIIIHFFSQVILIRIILEIRMINDAFLRRISLSIEIYSVLCFLN